MMKAHPATLSTAAVSATRATVAVSCNRLCEGVEAPPYPSSSGEGIYIFVVGRHEYGRYEQSTTASSVRRVPREETRADAHSCGGSS